MPSRICCPDNHASKGISIHRAAAVFSGEHSNTPKENKSVRASRSLAANCSGDMYATVPTAVPGLVSCASIRLIPKCECNNLQS